MVNFIYQGYGFWLVKKLKSSLRYIILMFIAQVHQVTNKIIILENEIIEFLKLLQMNQ